MFPNDNKIEKLVDPSIPTSNLAALFEMEKSQSTSFAKDVTLAYTAPRQPKSVLNRQNVDTRGKTAGSVVFCAKIITLAKPSATLSLPNIHGNDRLGLALIGNEQLQEYELLLYRDKQSVICRIKFESDFVFTVDANGKTGAFNYEKNVSLRVTFHSEQDCSEFSECIKNKGGQTVYQKFIAKDEMTTDIPEPLAVTTITKPPIETPAPILTSNDIIPHEQKLSETAANNLRNEPFSYLSNSKSEHNQTYRQLHRFPFSYNSAQLSDMGSLFPATHSHPFTTGLNESLNSIVTETRSQSCEMRMHMLQLGAKLDTLLRDVSDVKTQTLVNQNNARWLNTDSTRLNASTHPNRDTEDLNKGHDRLLQQLHNQQLTNVNVERLEIENAKLKCELENKNSVLSEQLLHIDDLKRKLLKLQDVDAVNKENMYSLERQFRKLSNVLETQTLKPSDCKQYDEAKKTLRDDLVNTIDVSIKQTMNKLYQNLINAFDFKEAYDLEQIETAVVKNLRWASYEMMENVQSAMKIIENVKDNEPKIKCIINDHGY